jgi:hypothetical protein
VLVPVRARALELAPEPVLELVRALELGLVLVRALGLEPVLGLGQRKPPLIRPPVLLAELQKLSVLSSLFPPLNLMETAF